ncbi:hypothetical protein ADL12_28385 [Streptomyces regalis]|uniref:Uncharacterized protein n=1 Tax=Streptomyces regalis TaxID=68262 RepID=A0A117MPS0_9ACTN|nr:hypothetical protein ADL12_28385 [Streptomyces regalis]
MKVKLQLPPLFSMGEWKAAGADVVLTSCGAVSWLVQVTVEPAVTVRVAGLKAYLLIATR